MRRYFLITVLILLVLITATTGIGWYLLHDEAFLKSHLSTFALRQTGRELTIKGPLRLSLGRETTLEARNIHFANATWADQPDMVAIGHLLVTVDLPSLFGDKPIFPAIALDDCAVSLVKNDAGEGNWDVLPKTETEPEKKKEPREDLPLWLKKMKIHNCQVLIAGPDLDHPLDIMVADLSMQHGDDNRWAGKGSGSVNDEELSLDGWFVPFSAIVLGGPVKYEMNFSLGNITLQSSGSVQELSTFTGANLTTHLQGPEIADILKEFKLPLFSEGPFDYTLRLNTEGKMTRLVLDGDLGSVDIKARGELDRLIKPTEGNIEFSVDGPNLGALAKIFDIDGLVEDAFSHESHVAFQGDAIHFRKTTLSTASDHLEIGGHFNTGPGFSGTELDIHFETEEIGRWANAVGQVEQIVGPLTLDGKLSSDANGLISIQSKVVHGESTLDVHGALGHLPAALALDLEISFKSADPKPLATLAGLKDFPAAPLAVQGHLGMQDKQVQLDKVNINLAGNEANIDGLINLKDRYAGSHISLGLDITNAGDLGRLFGKDGFPDQPVKLTATVKPEGKGLAFKVDDGNLGKIQIQLDGRIADLEHPLGLDGDFDISLPRLSDISFLLPNIELPDAPFTARGKVERKDSKVQLDKVHIDLAGNQVNIDGYINLVDRYAGSKINFDLYTKNAGELGRMFGKDGLPDQPMKLTATVKPAGKGLDFKVSDGNLRDIDVELEGHIADLDQPLRMDANFNVKLPRLSDISFLLPGKDLPALPFTASGRLVNEQSKTHLDGVHLELGKVKASIDGDLLPDNGFKLTIKAKGPDASKLNGLVGTSLPAEQFSLATSLIGNTSKFELKGLDVNLGRSQIDGDLAIGLGDVTQIKGKIDSPYLDLSHWYTGDQPEEEAKPACKPQWMFDDTPVMALIDHGLDIDLDLQVSELDLGNTIVEDIKLGFVLSHQLLEIKPFTFKGTQGGRYMAKSAWMEQARSQFFHLRLGGKDVRLGACRRTRTGPLNHPANRA